MENPLDVPIGLQHTLPESGVQGMREVPETLRPLHHCSAVALAELIQHERISSEEVTRYFLDRIARLDSRYGAFLCVVPERALEQARAADAARADGVRLGPLHGVPYTVKDCFDVAGLPTTAGCDLLANAVADRSAQSVQLLDRSGMVLLGKTKMVQFAHGSLGINLGQGTPRNPWSAVPVTPGGSSSGPAVAVATGMAPLGLGTDTGGSVRVPAALCGIVGFKTTYGLISIEGVYPLSTTLDTIGTLTRCAEDARALFAILAPGGTPQLVVEGDRPLHGMRLALPMSLFANVDLVVLKAVRAAAAAFVALGAEVDEIPFDVLALVDAADSHGVISVVEGYVQNAAFLATGSGWLDPMVVQSFAAGPTTSAAEYRASLNGLAPVRAAVAAVIAPYDALIAPTLPTTAISLDHVLASLASYQRQNSIFSQITRIANILGLCAASVPCGSDSDGLPIGLQIIGKPETESVVLAIAQAYLTHHPGGLVPAPPGID